MRYWCFLDKRYYRYWCDYLDLTIVDDVFSIFGFSCFWMVFMVLCFFRVFPFLDLPSPTMRFFCLSIRTVLLPFFLGLLTIVCDYMRWSPHIGQAMRCIVQVYTHLCRWSICWSLVPLLRLLAHTHRHDLCIHHALCVDHIKALGSEPKSEWSKREKKKNRDQIFWPILCCRQSSKTALPVIALGLSVLRAGAFLRRTFSVTA